MRTWVAEAVSNVYGQVITYLILDGCLFLAFFLFSLSTKRRAHIHNFLGSGKRTPNCNTHNITQGSQSTSEQKNRMDNFDRNNRDIFANQDSSK